MDLYTLWSLWPFMQWGLDVVGPLSRAQSQFLFLLVTTDYSTKWIEVVGPLRSHWTASGQILMAESGMSLQPLAYYHLQ